MAAPNPKDTGTTRMCARLPLYHQLTGKTTRHSKGSVQATGSGAYQPESEQLRHLGHQISRKDSMLAHVQPGRGKNSCTQGRQKKEVKILSSLDF